MFRRMLASSHGAAWLRRQFTSDADVVHDLRHGARLLGRHRAFTLLTSTVLAIGIGATTAIFSVVDAVLVRPLPYADPERIVLLFEAAVANRTALEDVAPANAIDWHEQARSVETMSAVEPFGFTYTGGTEPQSIPGARVTRGFFETFGLKPLYGRTFTADEFTAGRNKVVVLSYGTWAQRFGADPAVVGRVLRLNGQPYTVIGIMPPAFAPRLLVAFNERGIWTPKVWSDFEYRLRGARFYNVVANLKAGVTRQQAQAEFDGIAARLARAYPRTNSGQTVQLVSLRDHLAGDLRRPLVILSVAVLLLLAIAITNAANLVLAHARARSMELAVRSALGADRARLIRLLAAETMLLAGFGCLLGLVAAQWASRVIVSLAPADTPALASVGIDGRVLLFSVALTGLVIFLVGVAPASKAAGVRVADSITGAATSEARVGARHRGRTRLVVAELALAMTLLSGGGLLLRSFARLLDTSPGFSSDGVAALQVFARGGNRTPAQRAAFFQQIVDGMKSLPTVEEAGMASVVMFLETTGGASTPIIIEGRAAPASGDEPTAFVTIASPRYFPALRIPILEGRLFDEHDTAERTPVALVSRTFAERHWRNDSPVGQHIRLNFQGTPIRAEIVGIVGDVRHDALDGPPSQEVFIPHTQLPSAEMTFIARTVGDPTRSLAALKAQIYAAAPNQAVYRTATMRDLVARSLNERRFMLTLALAIALLAVSLAATGVYGVMSVISKQRTREFGLRLALGAGRGEILRMVMREGAVLTLAGMSLGLAGALAIGVTLRGFLFGIAPTDPWTLGGVCAVLGAAAALASLAPALRATRVDPLASLRTQ